MSVAPSSMTFQLSDGTSPSITFEPLSDASSILSDASSVYSDSSSSSFDYFNSFLRAPPPSQRTAQILVQYLILPMPNRELQPTWRLTGFLQYYPIAVGDSLELFLDERPDREIACDACYYARLVRIWRCSDPAWVSFELRTLGGFSSVLLVPSCCANLGFRGKFMHFVWTRRVPLTPTLVHALAIQSLPAPKTYEVARKELGRLLTSVCKCQQCTVAVQDYSIPGAGESAQWKTGHLGDHPTQAAYKAARRDVDWLLAQDPDYETKQKSHSIRTRPTTNAHGVAQTVRGRLDDRPTPKAYKAARKVMDWLMSQVPGGEQRVLCKGEKKCSACGSGPASCLS